MPAPLAMRRAIWLLPSAAARVDPADIPARVAEDESNRELVGGRLSKAELSER